MQKNREASLFSASIALFHVGAPTFSIFPLIFCSFSPDLPDQPAVRAHQEGLGKPSLYKEECREDRRGARFIVPLQRRVRKREVADGSVLGGVGGGGGG